jgi:hypothetical protein
LPCFAVHGTPVAGDFFREVAIAERSLLQSFAEGRRALRRGVVLHSSVDEPAPLAGLGGSVDRLCGLILQDDVDALCHGCGYGFGDLYS